MGRFQRVCVCLRITHLTVMNLLLVVAPASAFKKTKDIQFLNNCIFCTIGIHFFSVIVNSRNRFSFINFINYL